MDSVKTVGREPTPEMLDVAPASYSASFREIWPKICGDIWRAMWDAAPSAASPAGAEEVAWARPGCYGPKPALVATTIKVVADEWAAKGMPVTPLYAHPPTPSTDAVRRQAREEALEEAALAFDKTADACAAYTRTLKTGSDAWKLWVVSESENRRAARAVRALSTPPAGAAALNEGERP